MLRAVNGTSDLTSGMGSDSPGTNWTSIARNLQEILRNRAASARICGPTAHVQDPLVQAFKFWGSGVTISTLGGAGLIGNE